MVTKTQQLQRVVREYQIDGQKWPASTEDIAKWAVETGRYDLTRPTLDRQCARELAQAMRWEYFTDNTAGGYAQIIPRGLRKMVSS